VAALRLSGDDALLDDIVRKLGLKVASRAMAGSPRRNGGIYAVTTLNATSDGLPMTDDDGKRPQVGVIVTLRDVGGGKSRVPLDLGPAIRGAALALSGRAT
jgi:hypothetical protein